jgi:CBS domain-containing protein/sporulation protein YlmC with PRC-barrel domain
MPFISNLTSKPVTDVDGQIIGHLEDLLATISGEIHHPEIVALLVKRSNETILIPFTDVAVLVAPAIPLLRRLDDIVPYQPTDNDLYLCRDILDRQIIDTDGMRVVRVNDLELTRVDGHFYVANVDIGAQGLFRRLGLGKVTERLFTRYSRNPHAGMISWDEVELLTGDQPIRLKVPRAKIADLHPADLAEIISDLNQAQSSKFLETLDVKTVADVLEEVEPDFQASLVETMSDEKVADVLEEMAPDEAADLLAELPEDRSQELLRLMGDEDEEEVRKLLSYPEDQAGGIMTTEYVAVRPNLTAEHTIAVLRDTAQEAETVFYVYVTDEDDRLVGVFSLQDLVLAKPDTPVSEFMHHRVVCVNLLDSQEKVAQAVAKYNLLAVPVVDNQGRLHGIVTADDALDKIIPTKWKKRLPRLYH